MLAFNKQSATVATMDGAREAAYELQYPVVLRVPTLRETFTVHNPDELKRVIYQHGLLRQSEARLEISKPDSDQDTTAEQAL